MEKLENKFKQSEIYNDFFCGENNKNVRKDKSYGKNVFAEFLYGSQNYGLDTAESDTDTRTIVIPDLECLIEKKDISKTIELSKGLSDVKDIKTMFKQFYKSNPAYLELLVSDYAVFAPAHKYEFDQLREMADEIASRDKKALVYASYGMVCNKVSALVSSLGPDKKEIVKYGYDSKNASHALRIEEFIHRFLSGATLKYSLYAKSYDCYQTIIDLREHRYSLEEALELGRRAYANVGALCDKEFEKPNKEITEFLDDIAYSVIKRETKLELSMD